MTDRILKALPFLLAAWASAASAESRVVQVRSAEDPASPPDRAFCQTAPFAVNLLLGASLFTYEVEEHTGMIGDEHPRKIGVATACARLTNFTFPAGLQQDFYVRFDLPEGSFVGLGTCTLTSNDVPLHGFVLAGCALKMTSFPAGVVGGGISSLSSFNPFRLPGFATGSYWTLQYYDNVPASRRDDDSEQAMQWIGESQ
ncbi:MAG: hypothetical protein ACM3PC_13695 [Deltaproteobacteria bacterium]